MEECVDMKVQVILLPTSTYHFLLESSIMYFTNECWINRAEHWAGWIIDPAVFSSMVGLQQQFKSSQIKYATKQSQS